MIEIGLLKSDGREVEGCERLSFADYNAIFKEDNIVFTVSCPDDIVSRLFTPKTITVTHLVLFEDGNLKDKIALNPPCPMRGEAKIEVFITLRALLHRREPRRQYD